MTDNNNNNENVWLVDYLYITHIMEIPIQCMVDIAEKVDQFMELARNLDEHLRIAEEEYVHPLIAKEK